jgi:hypothetical protein
MFGVNGVCSTSSRYARLSDMVGVVVIVVAIIVELPTRVPSTSSLANSRTKL